MSKAIKVILDLLLETIKEEDMGLIEDVKFDMTTRLIVFKVKDEHTLTFYQKQSINKLKRQVHDIIKHHYNDEDYGVMILFLSENVELEFMTDEDLRKLGLQRIPEGE
jgi:hypothetical protein